MTTRAPIWFNASYAANSKGLNDVVEKAVRRLPRERVHPKVRRQIEALLCNCLATAAEGDGTFKIPMDNSANYYKSGNPYRHPDVERGSLPGLIRELASVNCLELVEAGSQSAGIVSRYGLGGDFKRAIQELSSSDVDMDHKGPVLYLREKGQRDWSRPADDREVKNKWFELGDHEIKAIADEIHDYNKWVETFGFSIDGAKVAPKDGRYYRLFLNSFLEHGRLYGHPIVAFPSDSRWRLEMDGEPLVELDITASLATIAYAKQSKFSLPKNPYVIPAVVDAYLKCSWPANDVERIARKCVKKVVVQRLCDGGPRNSYWLDAPGEDPFPWPRAALDCPTLIGLVANHLPALARYINSERAQPPIGLELMREEADIMLMALRGLRRRRIMALLVHDAVFVKRSEYQAGGSVVSDAFHSATGVWPTLKATEFMRPHEAALFKNYGIRPVTECLQSTTGKTPSWPRKLEEQLSSYRRQYQRHRDPAVQRLAGRLVAAWKRHKQSYLNSICHTTEVPDLTRINDLLPHSILHRALVATATIHRDLEKRGFSSAELNTLTRNGLRKMAIEDAGALARSMRDSGEVCTAGGERKDDLTADLWQGRELFHAALTDAGFPGPWYRPLSMSLRGSSGEEAI